ncbi:serine protease (plasmid) [Cereibacter azotoformans]|uniref:S1 family peptidase n=1 Tax=Cereibacter azotoformans TaxID=43057 RepID=UPI001F44CE96|nr:serine protease [Cereibacter azotoformans]UIJ33043.1 serine protease [Cereibacter azotoformans]
MADHFLTKSQIDLSQCLPWGGGLALEAHGALRAALAARISQRAADLFAEPLINRGNDAAPASISWYSAHAGEGRPLSELDETEQARVAAQLSDLLRPVRELLADSEDGTLIGAALHLAGSARGDVWVVDGQPVLINWGMLPAGAERSQASRSAHYNRTLGRFLPLSKAPPLTEDERRQRADAAGLAAAGAAVGAGAGIGAAAAGGDAPPPEPPAPVPPPDEAPPPRRLRAWEWAPLLVLLLLVGGAVIWLLIPGNRLFPPRMAAVVEDARAAEIAAEINAALEARRAALQAALDGAQCRADGTLIMPGGRTIEGLLPPVPGSPADRPGQRAEADPTPVLPPDPARVQVPDLDPGDPGSTAVADASLLEVIESRTVMVVARGPDGVATGSGFFVAPDLVMTNFHVVSGAASDSIFVTNRSLGTLRPTQLLRADGPFEPTGSDFALLRVPGVSARHFTLLRPAGSLKLQSVIAAGYPGDVLATDTAFAALTSGDISAVPDLTVTDGTVNTEQAVSAAIRAVVHSAPISQGNSGGPLVDMCGRVVGMNTFVRQGALRNLNFALSAPDVIGFLRAAGASPSITGTDCRPEVLRPGVPAEQVTPVEAGPEPGAIPGGDAPRLPDFGALPPRAD